MPSFEKTFEEEVEFWSEFDREELISEIRRLRGLLETDSELGRYPGLYLQGRNPDEHRRKFLKESQKK